MSRSGKHFVLRSGPARDLPTGVAVYGTGLDEAGWEVLAKLFEALLGLQRSRLTGAFVDAVSDNKDLPVEAKRARDRLVQFGSERESERRRNSKGLGRLRRGDPQMRIELDLRDAEHFELLRTYGLYSIHAEVFVEGFTSPAITAHDSGWSFTFLADAGLVEQAVKDAGIAREIVKRIG